PQADLAASLGAGCRKAVEIEVRHPKDGGRAWLYAGLYEGAAPRSAEDLVAYDPKNQSVVAREYKLRFDPRIPVGWDVLHFKEEDGSWTPNVLDRVKILIKASVLWGLMDAEKTEEDIHLRVLAWKDGPVRAIRRQATSMEMGLGLRSPETVADLSFLPDGLDQPIRIDLPFDPGGFFRDISWFIGLDFRGYQGAEWIVPNAERPLQVDGKMDAEEEALGGEDVEWMIIRHKRRAMIQRFKIEGGVPLTRELSYVDDAEGDRPPEYVRGQIPRAGYRLVGWERIKAGRYYTRIQTMKVPNYEPGRERDYVDLLDVALEARETPAAVRQAVAEAAPETEAAPVAR
ncbi:MAG: hypothetical protein K8I02_03745, partial [Candidatus Methylomirabilis sp.]|nr:hypothetical protein [Deltaproteobacteria bacterium]